MIKYATTSRGHEIKQYVCEICDYACSKKFLMTQHEQTKRHAMLISAQFPHMCKCGKQYRHIQSYSRHKKKCNFISAKSPDIGRDVVAHDKSAVDLAAAISSLSEQYNSIITENNEMRKIVSDLIPKIGNNNNTIINNNQFNIQVFLNEECKDAINMTEFIDTMKIDMADLNDTMQNGYVAGVTNIFMKRLKLIELHKRPIHCSDLKRDILYVKDNNVWEREGVDKKIMTDAISSVSKKQINSIKQWEELHKEWHTSDKGTTEYCKMIQQVASPYNKCCNNKIIKSIAKEVIIDK